MKVEERDRNPHPITGVSTSTAAFIGFAASGPFMPTPITSPTEYQLAFGSPNGTGFLGYAVRGFFQNGGTRCYVLRVEATVQPRMVKIFDRFEKARLAATTSLFGLPSPPPR
jgi:hypothetical protein